MHVGVVQANTPLQPPLLLPVIFQMLSIRSSTVGASTGRWTARRRLIQATNVKTTISLCPRAGRWEPTMPIHYTSSARTAGEHMVWLLQMDMHTGLLPKEVVPGVTGVLDTWLRLGQRTGSLAAMC